jgi:flagellin-like protein
LRDDRAASSVVGTVLLVAIVVILGAVVGLFVFDVGNRVTEPVPETSPSVEFEENGDDPESIVITHEGGDDLRPRNLAVTVTDSDYIWRDGSLVAIVGGTGWSASGNATGWPSGSTVSTGDTLEIADGSDGGTDDNLEFDSGETVRVVWESPDTDETFTLARFRIP